MRPELLGFLQRRLLRDERDVRARHRAGYLRRRWRGMRNLRRHDGSVFVRWRVCRVQHGGGLHGWRRRHTIVRQRSLYGQRLVRDGERVQYGLRLQRRNVQQDMHGLDDV